jgi:anti-sigma factor RsiW
MTHPTEALTALVDGALAPAERDQVEAHLASCAACRGERDRLARAVASLAALPPPPEPSPWFEARLAARLAAERRPGLLSRLGAWRWRFAAPAAALATAAAVTVVAVRRHAAEEEALAAHLDLMENYTLVAALGEVVTPEDAAVIASLDDLSPREGRP